MKILFVRHGKAVDASEAPGGDDMLRPLTKDGRVGAKQAFVRYACAVEPPAIVVSSEAVRAQQTAEILAKAFSRVPREISRLLNPGCNLQKLVKLMRSLRNRGFAGAALVGHEPDFSQLIADLTGNGELRIDVKKASLVQVDVDLSTREGTLELLLTPGAVGG